MMNGIGSWSIEEKLSYVTNNIVQQRRYRCFLVALFAREPGSWEELHVLCEEVKELEEEFELLGTHEFQIYVDVNWLPFPQSAYGPGYAIITFFCEALRWYSIALYNREAFLEGRIK